MSVDTLSVDLQTLNSLKTEFNDAKSKFDSNSYNTFKAGYISKCSDPVVLRMKSKMNNLYQKTSRGYKTVGTWMNSYVDGISSLENSLSSDSASATDSELRNYIGTKLQNVTTNSELYKKINIATAGNGEAVMNALTQAAEVSGQMLQNLTGSKTIGTVAKAVTFSGGFLPVASAAHVYSSSKEVSKSETSLLKKIGNGLKNTGAKIAKGVKSVVKAGATVIKKTVATVGTAVGSALEGILELGNNIASGVSTAVKSAGNFISYKLGFKTQSEYDAGKEKIKKDAEWRKDFWKKEFDSFYENNKAGQWLKENCLGFETTRKIGNVAGSVGGLIAVSIATGGTGASAALAGLAGFGKQSSEAWSSGASYEEGIWAGVKRGGWEAVQWIGAGLLGKGGKIAEIAGESASKFMSGFANVASKSSTAVVLDTASGFAETFVDANIRSGYNDKSFKENFEEAGGWNSVVTNTAFAAIASGTAEKLSGMGEVKAKGDVSTTEVSNPELVEVLSGEVIENPNLRLGKANSIEAEKIIDGKMVGDVIYVDDAELSTVVKKANSAKEVKVDTKTKPGDTITVMSKDGTKRTYTVDKNGVIQDPDLDTIINSSVLSKGRAQQIDSAAKASSSNVTRPKSSIVEKMSNVKESAKAKVQGGLNNVKNKVDDALAGTTVGEKLNSAKAKVSGVKNSAVEKVSAAKAKVQGGIDNVKNKVDDVLSNSVIANKASAAKAKVQNGLDNVKNKFDDALAGTTVGEKLDAAKAKVSGVKNSVVDKVGEAKAKVQGGIDNVKNKVDDAFAGTSVGEKLSAAKEKVGSAKAKVQDGIDNVKNKVDDAVAGTSVGEKLDAAKAKVSGVKNSVVDKVGEAKAKVQGGIDNVKNKVNDAFVESSVGEKFNAAKANVDSKIQAAKEKVQGGIDSIKNKVDEAKVVKEADARTSSKILDEGVAKDVSNAKISESVTLEEAVKAYNELADAVSIADKKIDEGIIATLKKQNAEITESNINRMRQRVANGEYTVITSDNGWRKAVRESSAIKKSSLMQQSTLEEFIRPNVDIQVPNQEVKITPSKVQSQEKNIVNEVKKVEDNISISRINQHNDLEKFINKYDLNGSETIYQSYIHSSGTPVVNLTSYRNKLLSFVENNDIEIEFWQGGSHMNPRVKGFDINKAQNLEFLNFKIGDEPKIPFGNSYKIYLPNEGVHSIENMETVLNFLNKNNIASDNKISKWVRDDGMCFRVYNQEDAKKVINFINNNNDIKVNKTGVPMAMKEQKIGVAIDGRLSYNSVSTNLLEDYMKNTSNPTIGGFYKYVDDLQSEAILGENCDRLNNILNIGEIEGFQNFDNNKKADFIVNELQIMETLKTSLDKSKTLDDYFKLGTKLQNWDVYDNMKNVILNNIS